MCAVPPSRSRTSASQWRGATCASVFAAVTGEIYKAEMSSGFRDPDDERSPLVEEVALRPSRNHHPPARRPQAPSPGLETALARLLDHRKGGLVTTLGRLLDHRTSSVERVETTTVRRSPVVEEVALRPS